MELTDTRPPFAGLNGQSPQALFGALPTPCYILDEARLRENGLLLARVAREAGCKILLAQKAFSNFDLYGVLAPYLAGTEASGLYEARLGREEMPGGEVHVFCAAYKAAEFDGVLRYADHIVFNSPRQLAKFGPAAKAAGKSVGLRINPGIDAHTHKFITTGLTENKFGIALRDLDAVIDALRECKNVYFEGLQFHIGSQITDIEGVYAHECRRADEVADYFEQKGMPVHNLDLGGGLGVDYDDPDTHPIPEFERWFKVVDASLKRRKDRRIHLEPGRALVAQCGTLVSQVLYVKHAADKDFLVLDAGMNDLIRPALYGARHRIMKFFAAPDTPMHRYDVVGPVCESSDVFAEGALLPQCQRGDLVGLRSAGAYGQVMSSRYNLRDMAPSVFSDRLAVAPMRESFPEK